jgi:hypothetical protein
MTEPGQSPLGSAGDKLWAAARLPLGKLPVVSFKAYFKSVRLLLEEPALPITAAPKLVCKHH